MPSAFLPNFHPVVTHGSKATLQQCLLRDEAVRNIPAERVRQRVLRWLLHDKEWTP